MFVENLEKCSGFFGKDCYNRLIVMAQLEIRKSYYDSRPTSCGHIRGICTSIDVSLPRCIATDGGWIRSLFSVPIHGIDLLLLWKVDTSLTERNKLWIPRYSYSFTNEEERSGTSEIFSKMVEALYTCCSTVEITASVQFDVIRFAKVGRLAFTGRRSNGISREQCLTIVDEALDIAEQYFYFVHTCRTGSCSHKDSMKK